MKRLIREEKYDFGLMMDAAELMPFEVSVAQSLGPLMLFMTRQVRGKRGKTTDLGILDQKSLLLPGKPEEYYWIGKLLEECRERGIDTSRFEFGVSAETMVHRVRYEGAVGFGGAPDPISAPPNTTNVLVPDFACAPSLCLFRKMERKMTEAERVFVEFLKGK